MSNNFISYSPIIIIEFNQSWFPTHIVENNGVEPLTSWMQIKRSSQLS